MKTDLQTLKVMVVDDEEDVRSLLGMMLKKRNFSVIEAGSGQEALEKIAQDKPDLIILDVHMPGLDGFQVHRKLHSDEATKHIPVLFCTALRIPDVIEGIKYPNDDYIQKPFDVVALQEKIANIARIRNDYRSN